jgi:hypothetical protein
VRKLVLAKPFSRTMQMTLSSATALLESSGAWLEINALNTFHPATDPDARVKEETLTLIHRVGPGRVLLSSDAGRPGLPGPPEAIAAGAEVLLDAGFSEADVRLMTSTNAASLVGVSVG